MNKQKFFKVMGIIFIISLLLEIFVFNFRFFETLNNNEILIDPKNIVYNDGLSYDPYNKWTNDEGELKPSFFINDKSEASFEIKNINESVDNIYIDISNVKRKNYTNKKVVLKIWATDEANKLYFSLPERDVVRDVEKSKYISLNLSGKSEKLMVEVKSGDNERFIINQIKLNTNYPMFFSLIRLLVVFLIMAVFYVIRPKSHFYNYVLNLKSKKQRFVLGIIIAAHIFGFIGVSILNPNFVFMRYETHLQYQQLTNSLLKGKVYLEKEPSEALKNMENPYDNAFRRKVLKEAGEKFLWDRAYYNGKYYVYFGIVPVLTFYLPFKVFTGQDFPTFAGIVIVACIMIFSVLGLINQIIKRWFKNVPFIIYILMSFFFIDSCGIMYLLKHPDFYSMPIIMAVMFSISGLYFWLSSFKYKTATYKTLLDFEETGQEDDGGISYENLLDFEEAEQEEDVSYENLFDFEENEQKDNISYENPLDFEEAEQEEDVSYESQFDFEENEIEDNIIYDLKENEIFEENQSLNLQEKKDVFDGFIYSRIFMGSLCMALVAGCRPQVLLGSFLAVPLFFNAVFKDRELFSKKGLKATILFLAPYVVVAIGLMYYNYIRFDSVFDFGANYNLTTNDMTKRGFVLGRSPLGIFMYLFQPSVYSPRFPFISDVWFYTNYMGRTIHEYLFGGILFNHLILCLNLFVFKFKNSLKIKGLFVFCIMSILFSVVIVIADTQMAGILQRYIVDFAWLMFIPAIILFLTLIERVSDYLKRHIYSIMLCCLALSFYYDFATIFFYGDNALYNANPTVHYTVAHLIQFWL